MGRRLKRIIYQSHVMDNLCQYKTLRIKRSYDDSVIASVYDVETDIVHDLVLEKNRWIWKDSTQQCDLGDKIDVENFASDSWRIKRALPEINLGALFVEFTDDDGMHVHYSRW